jgi:hypothetical protein
VRARVLSAEQHHHLEALRRIGFADGPCLKCAVFIRSRGNYDRAPVPHPRRMFTLSAAILIAITVAPSVILQVQTNSPAHLCSTILPG